MPKKRRVEDVDDEGFNSYTKPTENVHVKVEEIYSSSSKEELNKLLESFTKEHLIQMLLTIAFNSPKILKQIYQVAAFHYAHRKLFVYGLNQDITTRLRLDIFFSKYGEIEDSLIVFDKETRRSKGYGFIVFKTREGAEKALKDYSKMLDNRFIHCNLASDRSSNTRSSQEDMFDRKIYVGNVHTEIPAYKLFNFFSKYGEIERGPLGFDINTGKARGFAIFIYKTTEGARRALEEPMKSLNGYPLMYCGKAKGSSSSSTSPCLGLIECGVHYNHVFTSMGTFGCAGTGGFGCSGCGRGCHGNCNVAGSGANAAVHKPAMEPVGGGSNAAAPKPTTVPVGRSGGGDLHRPGSLFTMFMIHLLFILFFLLISK